MMGPDEAGDRPPRHGPDLAWPLRVVVGGAFITIVVLTLAQIFFRFVLDAPLIWSEELVRLLIVWVTFVGAAVVAYDGRHLNVDVAFQLFPPGLKRIVRWINLAVALAFLAALAWFSVRLIRIEGMTDMGALPLSYAWIRAPALAGAVLVIAFLLLRRFTGRGDPERDAL